MDRKEPFGTGVYFAQELQQPRPSVPAKTHFIVSQKMMDTFNEVRQWTCPLTMEIFVDPVVAADGHTYERASIEQWFKKSDKSPMTGLPLDDLSLFDNHLVRNVCKILRGPTP